uniref:Uncharacterized protein B14A21.010 n=1 Tax=Neurospora crassa TaxID=5141 RepID=Q870X1_NEUCS|nr:hypothetical protein [Neurospora crassa]
MEIRKTGPDFVVGNVIDQRLILKSARLQPESVLECHVEKFEGSPPQNAIY